MASSVLVLGSINMDYTAVVDRLPERGETVLGGDLVVAHGGKGANQAVAACRAGAQVALLGCVGDDAAGQEYLQALTQEGVDTGLIRVVPGEKTGTALIVVERGTGDNMIAVCPGANRRVTPQDVDQACETMAAVGVVVAQLEVPLETVLRAAEVAHGLTIPFVLNPSPVPEDGVPAELLALTTHLVLNEKEVRRLAGGRPIEDLEAAAHALLARGTATVVVTLGAEGCLVAESGSTRRIPGLKVTAVDAVGAGDAFAGVFAKALAEGHAADVCAVVANAAGALAVTRAGAMPSLPTWAEIQQVLAR